MKEAYDFTWNLLGVFMNCAAIFAFTFLIVGLIVVVYELVKTMKK